MISASVDADELFVATPYSFTVTTDHPYLESFSVVFVSLSQKANQVR